MQTAKVDSWEILPSEPVKAYAAFCLYRDLGIERSLSAAFRLHKNDSTAIPSGQWTAWMGTYEWKKRAEEYDLSVEKKARRAAEKEHREKLDDYRKRQEQLAKVTLAGSIRMLNLANKRLEGVKPEDIELRFIGNLYRAAAATAQIATEAEGLALSVGDLLMSLDKDTDADTTDDF